MNDQWSFVRRLDFEDLEVYQLAERLANEIWHIVKGWENLTKDTLGKQIVRSNAQCPMPHAQFPHSMTQQTSAKVIVIFDIDGVVRDVSGSYRRAIADTVEYFTNNAYRPTPLDIDLLKSEGVWNNDWEASQELIYRYFAIQGQTREQLQLDYNAIVAFFQSRYRGPDPNNLTGYICNEPLLLQPSYLDQLTQAGISWGFFSGATRTSANYVLEKRLGLQSTVLIAMEDAPGKPDPTGLFATVRQLENGIEQTAIIIYVGDTVADMYTVEKARALDSARIWIGVGVLPPHVQETAARSHAYGETLIAAGAAIVLSNVQELTPKQIQELVSSGTKCGARHEPK